MRNDKRKKSSYDKSKLVIKSKEIEVVKEMKMLFDVSPVAMFCQVFRAVASVGHSVRGCLAEATHLCTLLQIRKPCKNV